MDALKTFGLLQNIVRLLMYGGLAATDYSVLGAPAAGWGALRGDLHERAAWKEEWDMLTRVARAC